MKEWDTTDASFFPAYIWEWNGHVTREQVHRQIDDMYHRGIRAFYIIGAPTSFRPTSRKTDLKPDYLSAEYLSLVHDASQYAKSLGMYPLLYNEGDWSLEAAGVDFDLIDETFVTGACRRAHTLAGEHVIYTDVFVPTCTFERKNVQQKLAASAPSFPTPTPHGSDRTMPAWSNRRAPSPPADCTSPRACTAASDHLRFSER